MTELFCARHSGRSMRLHRANAVSNSWGDAAEAQATLRRIPDGGYTSEARVKRLRWVGGARRRADATPPEESTFHRGFGNRVS